MASRQEIMELIANLLRKGEYTAGTADEPFITNWRNVTMGDGHAVYDNPKFQEHIGGTYSLEDLSPEAYQTIARYTGPDYAHINRAFRDPPPEMRVNPNTGRIEIPWKGPMEPFVEDQLRNMQLSTWQGNINRGYDLGDTAAPTTAPEVVFRGVANPRDLEEGQRVVSMAPMSTSVAPRVASEFSEMYGGTPDPRRRMALYLPQGTPARFIGGESEQSHELETLLPPLQEWRVAARPTGNELGQVPYGYALEHMGAIDPEDIAKVYEDVRSGKLKYIAGAGAAAPVADFVQNSPSEKEAKARTSDLVRRYSAERPIATEDEHRLASIPDDVRAQYTSSDLGTPQDLAARDALISAREDARLRDLPNTNPATYALYQKAGLTPQQIAMLDPARQFVSDATMLAPASLPVHAVNALDAADLYPTLRDWESKLWQ